MRTLLELLQASPDQRTAIVIPESGERISYASLRAQVHAAAGTLRRSGVGRGDRVAMVLPNGLSSIVSFLAASLSATAAPLNPAYRCEEFSFYLEDVKAKLLIVPPQGAGEALRAAAGRVPVITSEELQRTREYTHLPEPDADDIALVLHTSGSTGRPKRVPLRHSNLAISARNIAQTYQLNAEDVSLCLMPLFHVHGLMASAMATFASGGTLVIPGRFNPLSFWRMVSQQRVTWYSAVPSIHQLIVSRRSTPEAHALRFVRSCSAALAPALMAQMESYFGVPVLEAYGMTEASHQMASNPLPPAERKPGSVGRGAGVEICIMDSEGRRLPAQAAGEVCVRGPNVIRAYENDQEATTRSFFGEWFRTGDQGTLDDEGYLRLTGRIKELINRGGEKIAPREIDEVLLLHPAVSEAVCFGVAHSTWGEEVEAAVVLREDAAPEELMAWCRDRLAEFKCPKRIHVLSSLPRTASGKIQRMNVAAALKRVPA